MWKTTDEVHIPFARAINMLSLTVKAERNWTHVLQFITLETSIKWWITLRSVEYTCFKQILNSDQFWSILINSDRCWSKQWFDQNWSEFIRIDQNWSELIRSDDNLIIDFIFEKTPKPTKFRKLNWLWLSLKFSHTKLFNMMHNQNMIHEGPVIYHNGCINKDITHETIVFYHDDLTELFQNKSLLEPFSQGLKNRTH